MGVHKTVWLFAVLMTVGCTTEVEPAVGLPDDDRIAVAPEPELGSAQEAVISGTVTRDRPEVGWMDVCTATLVAPDVLLCAAHCTEFSSRSTLGNYFTYVVTGTDGSRHSYTVDKYKAFATELGEDDLLLLHLSESVPADVATPAGMASSMPASGTAMSIYGYGCTRRGQDIDGNKRRFNYSEGSATDNLCPGDSGGPVFDDDGNIVYINSGYWRSGWTSGDIFGEVPRNHSRLVAQIEAWGSSVGGGSGDDDDDGGGGSGDDDDDAGGGSGDDDDDSSSSGCGSLDWVTSYTCANDHKTFVQCSDGALSYLYCPDSYGCTPGQTELYCYRGR